MHGQAGVKQRLRKKSSFLVLISCEADYTFANCLDKVQGFPNYMSWTLQVVK